MAAREPAGTIMQAPLPFNGSELSKQFGQNRLIVCAVKVFFLGCVLIAGLYGAVTVSRKILFIQAVPAATGLLLLLLA